MPGPQSRVAIQGSERKALPDARVVGAPSPDERITITVRLRTPKPLTTTQAMYTREQYEMEHGADPADISLVEQFAHEHNLEVVEISRARRTIRLSGTVENLQTAFGVQLKTYAATAGTYRGREGSLTVPTDVSEAITAVLGLDDRPNARPHIRPRVGNLNDPAFTPLQLAQIYNFPQGTTGKNQCIGILELGGGFRTKDLKNYFQNLQITPPTTVAISVDGAHNHPTNPNSADGEVLLDIEVAGAIAPSAQICVYFAPNTDAGFLDALTTAIHDSVHRPSVISISWGGPEDTWTDQVRNEFDQALQTAAALGITVCAAAGDDGSFDVSNNDPSFDGRARVDFPASNPFMLACGGTKLTASGTTITSETVWNELSTGAGATGGGISTKYAVPDYQQGINLPNSANAGAGRGRGVPDVSGNADPNTGYHVLIDGQKTVIGGTSAVAPLWAGLIARLNEQMGRSIGFINPLLYSALGPNETLNDVASGSNGQYQAGRGWDACTGWGSPDGNKILKALQGRITTGVVRDTAPSMMANAQQDLLTSVDSDS